MLENKRKKLEELSENQKKLEQEQEKNKKVIVSLKKELAQEEMTELFSLAKKFSRLFASGAVYKVCEEIREKLKIVLDYDPDFSKRFGVERVNDPVVRYFLENLFGSAAFEGGLYRVLDRMVKNRNVPGNPLAEETKKA